MVQAAIDMGGGNGYQFIRTLNASHVTEDAHGHCRSLAIMAFQH
jgi:hypothetical protein